MVMRVVTEAQKVCTTFFFFLNFLVSICPQIRLHSFLQLLTSTSSLLFPAHFISGALQQVCLHYSQCTNKILACLLGIYILSSLFRLATYVQGHPLLPTCAHSHCSYLTHGFGNVPTFEFNYGTAPSETKKPLIAVCFSLSSLNAPAEADQQKVYATDTDSLREEKKKEQHLIKRAGLPRFVVRLTKDRNHPSHLHLAANQTINPVRKLTSCIDYFWLFGNANKLSQTQIVIWKYLTPL